MAVRIVPMTVAYAAEIVTWRYPAPYDCHSSALDTGGGPRPELTGRGVGRAAISAGLAFGARQFAPTAFRMTTAVFNVRAQKVVRSLGFDAVGRFARRPGPGLRHFHRPG